MHDSYLGRGSGRVESKEMHAETAHFRGMKEEAV